jgi:hypothetical protein
MTLITLKNSMGTTAFSSSPSSLQLIAQGVDDTGQDVLAFSLDPTTSTFYFVTSKKQ